MIDQAFWKNRRVFLTGHTGFKGAWMVLLLRSLGAQVAGFSLPSTSPEGLFEAAAVINEVDHRIGDIRIAESLRDAISEVKPSVIIHMAAQSLVRLSYEEPVETYATNVMGTVNLLEAVRQVSGIDAVVVVTSDKCYENLDSAKSFREIDPMGGHDPYSSSKGCTELVTAAYRRSFFQGPTATQVASARAGNVIGGGEWARDRLVPDMMRAFIAGEIVRIRSPSSVRPWQHVLDPLIGYLTLAQHLVMDVGKFSDGWNFGPDAESEVPVSVLIEHVARHWGPQARWQVDEGTHPHEAAYLTLNCSKSRTRLGWQPLVRLDRALEMTCKWYRALSARENMRHLTMDQIASVLEPALSRGC